MKKLLLIVSFLFCALVSFAQFPLTQTLVANDSAMGKANALLVKKGLVNALFTDTTAANNSRISQYPFAQVVTADGKMWLRNATAIGWVEVGTGSGSGPTIYSGDSFITSDRTVTGNNNQFALNFDSLAEFNVTAHNLAGTLSGYIQISPNNAGISTQDADGYENNIYGAGRNGISLQSDSSNAHGMALTIDADSIKFFYQNRDPNTIAELGDYKLQARSPTGGFADYTGSIGGTNIYNADGVLTANRIVSGSDTHSLTLDSLPSFNIKAQATTISHVDSVGLNVNYSWATNPLGSEWSLAGSALTTDGVKTRINGTSVLTHTGYTGVEDWHMTQTIITNVKSSSTQTFIMALVPSWQSATFTREIVYVLKQDSGYINYYTNDGATTPDTSNKSLYTFLWNAGDTLDLCVYYSKGNIRATMTNRRTGQQSYFYIKLNSIANVALIKLTGIGDFYLLNNFKYYIDEPYRPQYSATGNSITIGSGASNIMYRWMNQTFQGYNNLYIIHGSSFERSTEALLRIRELCHVIKPQFAFWGDGVNDPGSSILPPAYAANVVAWVDSLIANNITPILISCSPQITNMTTYNDSLQAIASRFGLQYIDVFTLLVDPAGGTNRNPKYNADGVHFNDAGYKVWSGAVQKAIAAYLSRIQSVTIPHINLNPVYKYNLALDYNNQIVGVVDGIDDNYIRNILSTNVTTNGQATASISIGGRAVFFGSGVAGLSDFIVTQGGNLANPVFKISGNVIDTRGGSLIAATFTSGNFNVTSNIPGFTGGNVFWSGGATLMPFSSFSIIANNPSGNGIKNIISIDENAAFSDTIQRWRNNGVTKSYLFNDGAFRTVKASGYTNPYDYAALGANDWPTKTHLDSLLALVSGGGIANTNLGSFYRWVVPSSQGIKGAAPGLDMLIDSSSNANSLTFHVDTTTMFPQIRATITSGSGGVTTMGAFGSTPNANGASISSVTLTLQPADGTNPGGISTTTQTLAGAKTFSSLVNTTADKYSASGTQVLYYPHTFTNTLFVGNGGAAISNAGGGANGFYNTVVGVASATGMTTASFNVGIGSRVFGATMTGTGNVAAGEAAMNAATSAASNTAVGNQSMIAVTSGANNTAVGAITLSANQTGASNVAIGYQVMPSATGSDNSGLGAQTLVNLTTGAGNTAFGRNTAGGITTGSNNNILGDNLNSMAAAQSGTVVIGANGFRRFWVNSSGKMILGNSITNTDTTYRGADVTANGTFKIETSAIGTSVDSMLTIENGLVKNIDASGWARVASTGLTNSAGTWTADLSTGIAGGQTVRGGTAANDQLLLRGTIVASGSTLTNPNMTFVAGDGAGLTAAQILNNGTVKVRYLTGTTSIGTIVAGAGAGSSPTVSISGTDLAGNISITTGSLPTLSAVVATITFGNAYPSAPKAILITPANSNAALLSGVTMVFVDQAGISTTTFAITAGTTALTASTDYKFFYQIIQ